MVKLTNVNHAPEALELAARPLSAMLVKEFRSMVRAVAILDYPFIAVDGVTGINEHTNDLYLLRQTQNTQKDTHKFVVSIKREGEWIPLVTGDAEGVDRWLHLVQIADPPIWDKNNEDHGSVAKDTPIPENYGGW